MASSVTQHASNIPTVASTTVAKAFATLPAVNSTIVVQVASADSAALTLTCADNQAGGTNTYTHEAAADSSHTGADAAIVRVTVFRCKVVNVSAGTFTVTVSGGTTNTFWILGISECTPLDPVDASQVNGAASSTNPATATSGTTAATTQADEIAFATLCFDGYGATTGIATPAGYTSVALANNGTSTLTGSCDFKVLSATGTQTASWGTAINPGGGSPGSWSGSIITFKGATAGGNTITPPLGTLALTGLVPAVLVSANQTITPPLATLSLTGLVPTVSLTANQTIAVPLATLTLTGLVPTVQVGAGITIQVPVGALTLAAPLPSVNVTNNQTIAAPLATLSLSAPLPTILSGVTINAPLGQLTLAAPLPTISVTQNITINAPLAQLTLSAPLPIITGDPVAPVVVTGQTPAGRRKRYFVEVDGVNFPVADAREAAVILERARDLAQEAAESAAQEAVRSTRATKNRPRVQVVTPPTLSGSPELMPIVAPVRRDIEAIYRETSVNVELRLLLELEQRLSDDDDEAMLLLQ